MPIDLDKKDGEYGKKCGTIYNRERNKYEYSCDENTRKYVARRVDYTECDLFEYIIHTELIRTSTTFLTFKSDTLKINHQNFNFNDTHDLKNVEVYFPKSGKTETPLVLVITTSKAYCYEFSHLKTLRNRKAINTNPRFTEKDLLDKLISENNKQNNVITYRLEKRSNSNYDGVNVDVETHPSFDKYKHTPLKKAEDTLPAGTDSHTKFAYVLYNGRQIDLSKPITFKAEPKLDQIQQKFYTEITVYYFKLSIEQTTNPPKYLELKEKKEPGSEGEFNTYYLEKQGVSAIHWTQIDNPNLDYYITYFLDKRPSGTEKYNEKSITVTKVAHSSFKIYTHKPESDYQDKKGILRYNDKDLILEQNDSIEDKNKIKVIKDHVFISVGVYYYIKQIPETLPAFLELKLKSDGDNQQQEGSSCDTNSKCYLLQRNDTEGVKWQQIEYQDLSKTVTFQLEWKHSTGEYNDNVNVTKDTKDSFEIFTHTPTQDHEQKLGLLLYNWQTLTLQPNSELPPETTLLKKLHGNKYCKVNVYFSNKHPKEPPLFVELFENKQGNSCQPSGTASSDSTWLQRVDPDCHHWKQITKPDLGEQKAEEIIEEIKRNDKNSIMVQLTKKSEYPLKIIKHYRTDGIGMNTNPSKNIYSYHETLKNSNYIYYDHDFSESKKLENHNIDGLRTFVGNIEVKMYNMESKKEDLPYPPTRGTSTKLIVYLYIRDTFPLMINYNESWYVTNKSEYLVKWTQTSGLAFSDTNSLKRKLEELNRDFNEILLNETSENGYGISPPPSGQTPSGFDTTRVNVKLEPVLGKFGKVTHRTVNNSSIGAIKFGSNELQDNTGKKLSEDSDLKSGNFTTVTAYYHKNDSEFKKPLLLGFTKSGQVRNVGNPEMFYERESVGDDSKWKKIHKIADLRQNEGLEKRINNVHYTIGKSVMIQVDHQSDEGGSGSGTSQYQVQLVPNTNGGSTSGTESVGGDKTITVSKGECNTRAPPTNYTCFKHQIPTLTGSTSSEANTSTYYISGLKFYVCEKYLETHDKGGGGTLPIHYDTSHNHVKVYFYGTGTSNTPVDKVPLLAEYGGTYFKPSSRDGYFKRWVTVDVSGENDGRSDLAGLPQIGNVLEDINKELNQIQLEQTGDTSTGGNKYGITPPKPSEGVNCASTTPVSTFCERVTVTRNGDDGAGYYLKVTHKTVNQGPVGKFIYQGQPVTGIKTDELKGTCNQVDVYYRTSDNKYETPLLVCITKQGPEATSGCTKKWFSRMGVDVHKWNDADEEDDKYGNDGKIKDELEKIYARMANYLDLNISQQKPYQGFVQKGSDSESKNKQSIGTINVERGLGSDTYKPENYRYYQHSLSSYYTKEKENIQRQLILQEQEPTLQVRLYLFNNYFLGLFNEDGQSTLTTPLTYGSNDSGDTNKDPYVYFFENTGYGDDTTDKVPLLVKYGNQYFGPISKDNYFSKWKEYNVKKIGASTTAQKIKAALNSITRKLNEIDLKQTGTPSSEYGDIQPSDRSNPLGAKKRVTVTKGQGHDNAYHSVTHSTKDTGCVGTVKHNGWELQVVDESGGLGKKWSDAIEKEMGSKTDIYDSLEAYYHRTDIKYTNPLLIKITGTGSSGTRPPDLYYERANSSDQQQWKKVDDKSSLETRDETGIKDRINQIFYKFNKSVKIQMEKHDKSGYLAKLVKNGDPRDPGSGGIKVTVSEDKNCKISPGYTCIKHTVNMNHDISSQVGGLRFYFGDKEVQTFKDSSSLTTMPVFYDTRQKELHVYLQITTNVPLLFRYNSQCFKPLNKTNYFDKWVNDSGISSKSHPSTSQLDAISEMLNEINLEKTGQEGGGDKYGLDTSSISGLTDLNAKRITVKRDLSGSKGYNSVTHTTIDTLGIGLVRFGDSEVKDNTSSKNLSELVKGEPGIIQGGVNTVTVYYHTGDTSYTTPLMLGFGSTNGEIVGVDTGATTTIGVFYQRVDDKTPPVKWSKIIPTDTTELVKPGNDQKIAQKLNEIRYNIGKSIVIYVEKQANSGAGTTEYSVQVVENKSGGRPTGAGTSEKITVTKCTGTETQHTLKDYTCYTHQIPSLGSATESQYIGGVKFYVCSNNQYLPTFGPGGHPSEPIYYNSKHQTVTVYFYSNGHGPPSNNPDKVPLLVKYGSKYYRPSSRSEYFDKWVATQVQDEGVSTEGQNKLQEVLDTINKELNAIDLGQTNGGYGLGNYPGTACPCTDPATFCDRVKVEGKKVTGSPTGSEEGGATSTQTTLFYKVTHTTNNKGGIGSIYSGGQVISAIDTSKAGPDCNLVSVYYDGKDASYKTPLLVCLCQQALGQATDTTAATTTTCKTWFKRTGIDITDWVAEGDGDTSDKFGSDNKIQSEIQSIIGLFKDYLYLDLGSRDKYQPSVQHQTGPKQKVGEGGQGTDTTKIQVTEATTGAGADQVQVPNDYKAYTHGLTEFYKGAKKEIKQALNPATANQVPGSGEDSNPELHLRLQVGGQVLALLDNDGKNPVKPPLTLKPTEGESETNGKNDPYVYFYKGNSGAGTDNPDWVPLLFKFGTQYFGPKDRDSYFNTWCEYTIEGGGDALKQKLEDINLLLNGVDLTQTGTRGFGEYGLEKPGVGLTGDFKTKRIQVTHKDNPVMSSGTTMSTYTTVTHTTTNGYNIGSITGLGTKCEFDNAHTSTLGVTPHNQVVAVYGVGADTSALQGQNPSLVLIAQSTGRTGGLGTSSTSTVHGYYNLSGGCPSSGKYEFKTVTGHLTVGDITSKEKMTGNAGLVEILQNIGVLAQEIKAPVLTQALAPDSASGQDGQEEGQEDPGVGSQDEGQDDRPKVGSGAHSHGGGGHDARGGSGGVDSGSPGQGVHGKEGLQGPPGQAGKEGPEGKNGETGPQGARGDSVTDLSTTSPGPDGRTTPTREVQTQEQHTNHDGGGNDRSQAGEARPQAGDGGSGASENTKGTMEQITDFIVNNPAISGGAGGGVAGVGVIGGVGAVVYKKCVAGTAVAAGKAAVEMRYFVVVKPISNTELKFKVYDNVNIIKSYVYRIIYILI